MLWQFMSRVKFVLLTSVLKSVEWKVRLILPWGRSTIRNYKSTLHWDVFLIVLEDNRDHILEPTIFIHRPYFWKSMQKKIFPVLDDCALKEFLIPKEANIRPYWFLSFLPPKYFSLTSFLAHGNVLTRRVLITDVSHQHHQHIIIVDATHMWMCRRTLVRRYIFSCFHEHWGTHSHNQRLRSEWLEYD